MTSSSAHDCSSSGLARARELSDESSPGLISGKEGFPRFSGWLDDKDFRGTLDLNVGSISRFRVVPDEIKISHRESARKSMIQHIFVCRSPANSHIRDLMA